MAGDQRIGDDRRVLFTIKDQDKRMAEILLVGGFPDDDKEANDVAAFVRALAAEIIKNGHRLLGGCQTTLDREVAVAAEAAVRALSKSPDDYVISYLGKGCEPIHSVGCIRQSALPRWDLIGHRLTYPEPIMLADAAIIVAGWEGTHRAANWARIAKKPLLPIATFGCAAEEIYRTELDDFNSNYASRVTRNEYEQLNRVLAERSAETLQSFAEQIVSLAERIITPRDVFVIMSFSADPDLEDAYETFCTVCSSFLFNAYRVDHHIEAQSALARRASAGCSDPPQPLSNGPGRRSSLRQ